jgi:hypothetical protein
MRFVKFYLCVLTLITTATLQANAYKVVNETGSPLLINKTHDTESIDQILETLAEDEATQFVPINSKLDAKYDRKMEAIIAVSAIEGDKINIDMLKPASCRIYRNSANVTIAKIAGKIYCACSKKKDLFGRKICDDLKPGKIIDNLFHKWRKKNKKV